MRLHTNDCQLIIDKIFITKLCSYMERLPDFLNVASEVLIDKSISLYSVGSVQYIERRE